MSTLPSRLASPGSAGRQDVGGAAAVEVSEHVCAVPAGPHEDLAGIVDRLHEIEAHAGRHIIVQRHNSVAGEVSLGDAVVFHRLVVIIQGGNGGGRVAPDNAAVIDGRRLPLQYAASCEPDGLYTAAWPLWFCPTTYWLLLETPIA